MNKKQYLIILDDFLPDLNIEEKIWLAELLSIMESNKENKLRKLANQLINSSKINSNSLREAGMDLKDILDETTK